METGRNRRGVGIPTARKRKGKKEKKISSQKRRITIPLHSAVVVPSSSDGILAFYHSPTHAHTFSLSLFSFLLPSFYSFFFFLRDKIVNAFQPAFKLLLLRPKAVQGNKLSQLRVDPAFLQITNKVIHDGII